MASGQWDFQTGNSHILGLVQWSSSSNGSAANTSTVHAVAYLRRDNGYTSKGTVSSGAQVDSYVNWEDRYMVIQGDWVLLKDMTTTVAHNDNGTGTCYIRFCGSAGGFSLGSYDTSSTVTLDTIPRASDMTVANGTLGTAQNITVDRKADAFTHTLTYTCGSTSGTIATKSSSTTISFTPPLSLASQDTTNTSVGVTFKLQTYNGSTAIGNAVEKTVSMAMPASVKPSCSLTVDDATSAKSSIGSFVQAQSKFSIKVSTGSSYGATISSYKVVANGSTYTSSTVTTQPIISSGNNTITVTVTDSRGRSATTSTTVSVLAYSPPSIKISAARCNADGNDNPSGTKCKISYNAVVTSLNSKNTKTLTLKWRNLNSSAWEGSQSVSMSSYSVNSSYIFAADDGRSYEVVGILQDKFTSDDGSAIIGSGFALMHFRRTGKGLGIGKISEKDALEVGMDAYFSKQVYFADDAGVMRNLYSAFNNYIYDSSTERSDMMHGSHWNKT